MYWHVRVVETPYVDIVQKTVFLSMLCVCSVTCGPEAKAPLEQ